MPKLKQYRAFGTAQMTVVVDIEAHTQKEAEEIAENLPNHKWELVTEHPEWPVAVDIVNLKG